MPRSIPRPDALLIVCRALNPFVGAHLLSGGKPAPGAEDFLIKGPLQTILKHDQDKGEHAIDAILHKIVFDVQDEGFALTLGKGQLVNDYDKVADLVTHIVRNTRPI